jgi:hypothetical protein
MNHTERDIAIYTQVAFKAAVDLLGPVDILDPDEAATLENSVLFLSETLISAIEVNAGKHASAAASAAKAPAYSGSAPAAPANADGFELRVKGEQHGPIPAWAIKKAIEENVTEVYDNRGRLAENPRLPWFKATDRDIPFWDPASRPVKKGR